MADHCANSSGDGSGCRFGDDRRRTCRSAAILDPATGQLVGVNPALLVLATAAGSNTLTHINDGIFLVVQRLL
ncbi:hypothetical protein ACLBR5_29220 [Escherichia coli]